MFSNNKKELDPNYINLEENQNYIDMTKALILSLVFVAVCLIVVIAEICISSFT